MYFPLQSGLSGGRKRPQRVRTLPQGRFLLKHFMMLTPARRRSNLQQLFFSRGLYFVSPEMNGARSSLVQMLCRARLVPSFRGSALSSFAPGRWARTAGEPER